MTTVMMTILWDGCGDQIDLMPVGHNYTIFLRNGETHWGGHQ